ncbi:MAG: ferritin-like domain-containing protein [Proteobacteria bacterium]|nr:ferritin-like domain-containing protein [Pseudomonadota bacterium]
MTDTKTRLAKAAMTATLVGSALTSLACAPAPKGRVVRIGGETRTAGARRGSGWNDGATPSLTGMTLCERSLAGEGWRLSAELEHAAVAAFAELSHRLMLVGAPAELVARSHIAALDEIRHAERCFALASGYFKEPVSAAPFEGLIRQRDPGTRLEEIARLAVGSLRDGAVGEGVAALTATHASEGAIDPVIRDTLATIGCEEAEHAALGWATIAWCLEEGGELVAQALEEELDQLTIPAAQPPVEGVSSARLAELGLLPQDVLGRLAEGVVEASKAQCRAWIDATRERVAS